MDSRLSKAETFVEESQEDVLLEMPTKYKWIFISLTLLFIILLIAFIYAISISAEIKKIA